MTQRKTIADTEEAQQVAEMMERARAAQAIIETYSQEKIDGLITAMVWSVCQPGVAEMIAQHTVDETQLGNYAGKYAKISVKTRASLMDIIDDKSVGVIEVDEERAIVKIAKPIGVIGALSPSTNPEATPVIKGINAVKGRNAIVICPHPRAKLTNKMIVDIMREAIVKMGAPADIIQTIDIPSLELTNEVMKQCDLVMATGGAGMVRAAYSSGTPAYGVGAGNAVITVDDSADMKEAAEKIRISKTLDLAASCSADNSVLVFESVKDQLVEALVAEGVSPIMAFYTVKDIDEAIELTNAIQAYQGMGHSCGIYSYDDNNIMKLASATKTSRVMVNQAQAPSNSGNLHNGMRQTFSLGCGTWGGSITDENLYWRHLVNVTWVSKNLPTPKVLPSDDQLFGRVKGKLAHSKSSLGKLLEEDVVAIANRMGIEATVDDLKDQTIAKILETQA